MPPCIVGHHAPHGSVRIGNAIIKEFKTKSPHRIVFSAPSADAAGSPGEKTLVLHSSRYGRTVVPRGFTINDKETFGSVHPSNVPLKGGTTVTVDVPDLSITQQAESFGIALAGIPARIVSVSNTRPLPPALVPRPCLKWLNV